MTAEIGPRHNPGDTIRHWVAALRTENPNTLYDLSLGCRRQAEIDDHSEVYARTYEGNDIFLTVNIPEGLHRVSLYFFNDDATEADNYLRDYLIEVKPFIQRGAEDKEQRDGLSPPSHIEPLPDLDALTGPGVGRWPEPMSCMGDYVYAPPGPTVNRFERRPYHSTVPNAPTTALYSVPLKLPIEEPGLLREATLLWASLDAGWNQPQLVYAQRPGRLAALRAASAGPVVDQKQDKALLIDNWTWALCHWDRRQRTVFDWTMKEGWRRFSALNNALRAHTVIHNYKP